MRFTPGKYQCGDCMVIQCETFRKDEGAGMSGSRVVLCGANAYDKKYYFNKEFAKLPQSIQEELHIICVLFTEEVGGIFTIGFEEDGSVTMQTEAAEEDYLYDEIGSGLLVSEVRRKRTELFESLSLYYRAAMLKEDVTQLLERQEEGEETE